MRLNNTKPRYHWRFADIIGEKAIQTCVFRQDNSFHVRVPKSFNWEVKGKRMEGDKEYVIEGRVVGTCRFQYRHFESIKAVKDVSVVLCLGNEAKGKLIPGDRSAITIDSITERRDFKVNSRKELVISDSSMTSLGLHKAEAHDEAPVFEFDFKNLSKPNAVMRRYFVVVRPGMRRIHISSGRLKKDTKAGDLLRLESTCRYSEQKFAEDFNAIRPEKLKNVRLGYNGRLLISVDGITLDLRSSKLTAVGLRVRVTAKIGDTGRRIRLYHDGERAGPILLGGFGIHSLKASDAGLEVGYSLNQTEARKRLLVIDQMDWRAALKDIVLVSPPRREREPYYYQMSESLRGYLALKLECIIEDMGRYVAMPQQTKFSEAIMNQLVSLIPGWQKVREHPFANSRMLNPMIEGGPDALYRWLATNELYYFEFKLQMRFLKFFGGSKQIRRYLSGYPEYNGEKVIGGFVGILNWDTRSRDLFLYVIKVNTSPRAVEAVPLAASLNS